MEVETPERDVHIIETHTAEDSASLEEIEKLKDMMRTLWPKDWKLELVSHLVFLLSLTLEGNCSLQVNGWDSGHIRENSENRV